MTIYAKGFADSSFIQTAIWDSQSKILLIKFKSGSFWSYYNIDQQIYESLISAKSIGGYFNKNIKDKYTSYCLSKPSEFPEVSSNG